ncbi:UNVERIFIED_CONTAM: hypothetical protein K2H54_054676 [Gekko kuhli]
MLACSARPTLGLLRRAGPAGVAAQRLIACWCRLCLLCPHYCYRVSVHLGGGARRPSVSSPSGQSNSYVVRIAVTGPRAHLGAASGWRNASSGATSRVHSLPTVAAVTASPQLSTCVSTGTGRPSVYPWVPRLPSPAPLGPVRPARPALSWARASSMMSVLSAAAP